MIFSTLDFTTVTSRMQKGHYSALIVGSNNLDKHAIIKNILHHSVEDKVLIFSASNNYENSEVHRVLDYEKLSELMKHQARIGRRPPYTVVIDGCEINYKNTILSNMVFNGLHYGINLVISTTADNLIPASIRCNFDNYFVLNEDSEELNRLNWRYYCGMFPNFNEFNKHFQANVLQHQALVINNSYMGNCLDKMCLHYEIHSNEQQ